MSELGLVWAMNSERAIGAGLWGVGRLRGDALLERAMVVGSVVVGRAVMVAMVVVIATVGIVVVGCCCYPSSTL